MEENFKPNLDNIQEVSNSSNDEMSEVELWEFTLDEVEIDELIGKLQELKQNKTQVSFDVDETNELVINYQEDEDDEDDEETNDEEETEVEK